MHAPLTHSPEHMNCATNRSDSPWPRIVGAAGTVTVLYVTRCREVEAAHEAPTHAQPCAYVSIQSFFFWLPNACTQCHPANARPRRCTRSHAFSASVQLLAHKGGEVKRTGPRVVRRKRVDGELILQLFLFYFLLFIGCMQRGRCNVKLKQQVGKA